MKILYAVHAYKPAYRVGGPVLSVSAAAEALVRRGHTVTVFTTNSNLDEDLDVPTDRPVNVEGVEVWYFRREEPLQRWFPFVPYLSKSMGYLYAPGMRAQLDLHVPEMDVVHTHMPFVYPTYAAAMAARRYGKKLYYHQRGNLDPARLKFRSLKKMLYIRAIELPIMRSATMLIALTEAERMSYRALGVRTPCRVIPNGIDVSIYRQEAAKESGLRWKFSPKVSVILFLSRVHPIKGADKLLDAFLQIHSVFPDAVLVLAGPDEWGLEEKYRDLVLRAGLKDRVFFPGMVTGEEKIDLLARADLFCLPSEAEGFSMAVLEGLASGTPVLLSPGCHFPEVEIAGAGKIAPAEPDAIAEALSDLLRDPVRLREMGRRAREFVSRNYTWDRIIDQLLDVYEEGLHRS